MVSSLFVKLKLFCLVSVLSDAFLTLLIGFFSFDFFNIISLVFLNFFFFNICCCCCLILSFVLICFLNNGWSHHSNAVFFTPLRYLSWSRSFCSSHFFLKITWIFGRFLLFLLCLTFMPNIWMGGVETFCADAHYRAFLFSFRMKRSYQLYYQHIRFYILYRHIFLERTVVGWGYVILQVSGRSCFHCFV